MFELELKKKFKLKTNTKPNTRQPLKHMYLHASAKPATAEGLELRSPNAWIRRPTVELFVSAAIEKLWKVITFSDET